jgi:hypothetical protein
MKNQRKNAAFAVTRKEKAWNCPRSGLGSYPSTGRHPVNQTIRARIAGLWVTSRQIAVFLGLVQGSGFLEIIPGSAVSDGAQPRFRQDLYVGVVLFGRTQGKHLYTGE